MQRDPFADEPKDQLPARWRALETVHKSLDLLMARLRLFVGDGSRLDDDPLDAEINEVQSVVLLLAPHLAALGPRKATGIWSLSSSSTTWVMASTSRALISASGLNKCVKPGCCAGI